MANSVTRSGPSWLILFALTILIAIAMNILHEAGHAAANAAMGYDMVARINSVTLTGTSVAYRSVTDRVIADAAGPLVTILIAVAAWLHGRRNAGTLAPTIVAVALAMRLLAAAVSLGNPNDEARISLALGLGPWTIFALVIAGLGALFVTLFRRERELGWRWLLITYLALSVAFAGIVFSEPYLPAFVIRGFGYHA